MPNGFLQGRSERSLLKMEKLDCERGDDVGKQNSFCLLKGVTEARRKSLPKWSPRISPRRL